MDRLLVLEAHLRLGRMDVHVYRLRRDLDEQHGHRVAAPGHGAAERVVQRPEQDWRADCPPIHVRMLHPPVRPRQRRPTHEPVYRNRAAGFRCLAFGHLGPFRPFRPFQALNT